MCSWQCAEKRFCRKILRIKLFTMYYVELCFCENCCICDDDTLFTSVVCKRVVEIWMQLGQFSYLNTPCMLLPLSEEACRFAFVCLSRCPEAAVRLLTDKIVECEGILVLHEWIFFWFLFISTSNILCYKQERHYNSLNSRHSFYYNLVDRPSHSFTHILLLFRILFSTYVHSQIWF
jgi:hypothetical protein